MLRKEQREPCSLCKVEILLSGNGVYVVWVIMEGTRNPGVRIHTHIHTHTHKLF